MAVFAIFPDGAFEKQEDDGPVALLSSNVNGQSLAIIFCKVTGPSL